MGQRSFSARMISGKTADTGKWWVIPLSFAVALTLVVIPYPDWVRFAVPHWVTLVLLYWCIAVPDRIGVGTGWCIGLLLDLILHTLFGTHAVSKAFIAMVGVAAHRRMRMYPLWQQCAVVFVLCAAEITFVGWIFHLTNDSNFRFIYWQAAFTSALVWPAIYTTLRFVRQRSGMIQIR